jgi:hypothetical protein
MIQARVGVRKGGLNFMENIMADILQSTFSVAVAAYLLVRMESRLDGLTSAIVRLDSAIELWVKLAKPIKPAAKKGEIESDESPE